MALGMDIFTMDMNSQSFKSVSETNVPPKPTPKLNYDIIERENLC